MYQPDEHRYSAPHCEQDIGVSAAVQLSWALWHRSYPDQSARAADCALALIRQLGHAHTLAHALGLAGVVAVFARDVATVYALATIAWRSRVNGVISLWPDAPGLGRRTKG